MIMPGRDPAKRTAGDGPPVRDRDKVKFELYGTEVLDKQVAPSGSCGRVYLPLHWLGKKVKIIRVN
jgi:putative transposon-encoded protein